MNVERRHTEVSTQAGHSNPHSGRQRPIVLVVEDSEDDFFLLHRAFKKLDAPLEVLRLEEGTDVVRYLTDAKGNPNLLPALTFLDLKLPGMSGFDVLKWIRNDPEFKLLVVNVLSSSAEQTDIHRAFDLGANAYTVKPMSLEEYDKLLSTVLKFWLEISKLPLAKQPKA